MKPIVIVETPYTASSSFERERNDRYLRAALRDCLLRGEAPFASHAIYTLPGVLDDANPVERRLGIDAGFSFRRLANLTVVYTDLGVSPGMQEGIDHALTMHAIEYRTLPVW